jgi:hypothetical protein
LDLLTKKNLQKNLLLAFNAFFLIRKKELLTLFKNAQNGVFCDIFMKAHSKKLGAQTFKADGQHQS